MVELEGLSKNTGKNENLPVRKHPKKQQTKAWVCLIFLCNTFLIIIQAT